MATGSKSRSKTNPSSIASESIDSPSARHRKSPGVLRPLPDESSMAEPTPVHYDRSSMPTEFMVTILGQTEVDFLQYAPQMRFCELIDGVVYMPSPVDWWHQFITQFLCYLLMSFRHERGCGMILTGPAVLKLDSLRLVEPDVFVMPSDTKDRSNGDHPLGPAAFVVEVLSPSNRNHDLVSKAQLYREAGVPEVWYVDPRDRVVVVERTQAGRTLKRRYETGVLECLAVPGFWIEVDWLWADPLPDLADCSRKITRGNKPKR